jgi:apoptosis-inducing factor 3
VHLGASATMIDTAQRTVEAESGSRFTYDALLIAMGAAPVRLNVPGADLPHIHYVRTLADSRAIIESSKTASRVVVIGSSFIELEVAAALRKRELEVHVVASGPIPMQRVMGPDIGSLVRQIHEEHGVRFHLGTKVVSIDKQHVTLATGEKLSADLVIVGIGVTPTSELAEKAGLATENGITVNAYLETSVPGIFAAGDLAQWPDPHSGEKIRVEHWVVAERQGQTAARNMLGRREAFDAVPFFWSMHYDIPFFMWATRRIGTRSRSTAT